MYWDKICLMLPTYGRSKTSLPVFIETALRTAKRPNDIMFSFCVNQNDFDTENFIRSFGINTGNYVIVKEQLAKPNLAIFFNKCYEAGKDFGDQCLATMMGDDMEFKTNGWDDVVLKLINKYDGIGVFWCNDDYIAHERMCVNMFITRKMVKATETIFMDELFLADMIDYIWYHVGRMTKSLHYLPDIIIKHNHNTAKPVDQWDNTFIRLRPAQAQGHAIGKLKAHQQAEIIAKRLISKGFMGDNK